MVAAASRCSVMLVIMRSFTGILSLPAYKTSSLPKSILQYINFHTNTLTMSSQPSLHHLPKSANGQLPSEDAIDYEWQTYTRGLDFERPPLTFEAAKWEELACNRLSSESKGYVYGSAGVRETTDKNRAAFRKWSIVPRRLVKTEGFPDLKTEVLGEALRFPVAMAPVGVLKIFSMF